MLPNKDPFLMSAYRSRMVRSRSTTRLTTIAILLLGFFASLPVMAQQAPAAEDRGAAEAALSNDTILLRYYDDIEGTERRLMGSGFLSEERDIVLSAGMLWPVELGKYFDISVGPQLYAALLEEENQDVMAVSIGAELRWFMDPSHRFAIAGQAFYAPDILTFGSADNLVDLSARAEMRLSDRVIAFAGMRWFEFDLTDGSGKRTLQDEIFVGVRYRL